MNVKAAPERVLTRSDCLAQNVKRFELNDGDRHMGILQKPSTLVSAGYIFRELGLGSSRGPDCSDQRHGYVTARIDVILCSQGLFTVNRNLEFFARLQGRGHAGS